MSSAASWTGRGDAVATRVLLLRHGQSEWNEKNLFTGWVDVALTEKGREEATRGGHLLTEAGILPDIVYKINDPGMSAVWSVVPAVKAAIDAGRATVERLGGKLIMADVIARPHPDLAALLPAK